MSTRDMSCWERQRGMEKREGRDKVVGGGCQKVEDGV